MKRFLLAAMLLLPPLAWAGEITKVSVLDKEFREIKVLSTEVELSLFEELWSKKTKQEPTIKVEWLYKLDIAGKSKGGRWLYHPAGWVQAPSKQTPVYKLSSPKDFNRLLGIHNTSLNGPRATTASAG